MDFSNIPDGHEDGEQPVVFYYNREERLRHAPQNVKDYYNGNFKAFRPGLFKALVSTKANRFILFALVVCFLMVLFLGFFGPKLNAETYKGIPFELTSFLYDGRACVKLKIEDAEKKYRSEYLSGIPISVKFIPYDVDNNVIVISEVKLKGGSEMENAGEESVFVTGGSDADVVHRRTYEGKSVVFYASFEDFDVDSVKAEIEMLDRVSERKILLTAKVAR